MQSADDGQNLKRALFLHQKGDLNEAANLYRQLIAKDPKNFHALHFLGIIEASAGKIDQAKALMARSLSVQPPNIQFIENYAAILCQCGDYDAALQTCRHGLEIDRANTSLLYVDAISLFKLNQLQESLTQFDKLLSYQPKHIAALNERGSVLAAMKRYDAALASVEAALMLNSRYAEAHLNKGNLCSELKRYDEALTAYGRALALRSDLADAWLGRGNVFRGRKRFDEALAAYDKALALSPGLANAWLGRGNVFYELKRDDEAIAAYDKALALSPDLAEAWYGRGNALSSLKRHDDALAAYDRAFKIQPELRELEGRRLHAKQLLCDWSGLEDDISHLLGQIRGGVPASPPFTLLAVPSSPADQLRCANDYIANLPAFPPLWSGTIYAHDRIRIAYLSSDFREHAIAYLTAGLFEEHHKSQFEVTALSYGLEASESDMRRRVKAAVECFVDVSLETDQAVAELIERLEIDIAIDLNGITGQARPNILSRRPAPIQVNYLGYPGTTGAGYMDYILADSTVIPGDQFAFFSEKIVWLPDAYQVNDRARRIAEYTPTRDELGLPNGGFVYCCFNNCYKIMPAVFDIWMRLLREIDGSVLWLLEENSVAVRNLRDEAARRGVEPDRLVFAPRLPLADHLARCRQADLFLDTLPYNAHTTASDALWAGVPVLTCLGPTFAGRVAASLLKAVGLPELVTTSLEDYEALARKIAEEPALCASLRQKLARNREVCPLFDTRRFTRDIESAFTIMWQRYQRGEPPQSFAVEPS